MWTLLLTPSQGLTLTFIGPVSWCFRGWCCCFSGLLRYTLPGFRWDIFPPCAAPASIIGSDVLFCRHNRLRICSVLYRSLDQGGEESRSGRLYSRESQNLNYLEYSVCDLWPKVYPVQCHDQDSSNGSQGYLWIPSALDIASIDLNRPCRFMVTCAFRNHSVTW